MFLANISLIGAIFIVSQTTELNFFDSFVLMGIFCGSAMAYLIKGMSIWNLKTGVDIVERERMANTDVNN